MNIGIDIVENERINKLLKTYGDQFLAKFLSTKEINQWLKNGAKITTLCGLFAAKEAVVKAVSPHKINLTQIEIVYLTNQAPFVSSPRLPISLSISHEKSFSVAVALCDAEDKILTPNL